MKTRALGTWAIKAALATLGTVGAVGCGGDYSVFDVSVTVAEPSSITQSDYTEVERCTVTVSGAASAGPFDLKTCLTPPTGPDLGTFQFATTDSGEVNFLISLLGPSDLPIVGTGTGSGHTAGSTRVPVSITVTNAGQQRQ